MKTDIKETRIAFVLNICIFILSVVSIIWMIRDLGTDVSTAEVFTSFCYFSIDSNILIGLAALVAVVDEGIFLFRKKESLSKFTYVFKLAATACITLSFLMTALYLTPSNAPTRGWIFFFKRSNFLINLVIPVLSMVVFEFFERTDRIDFGYTFVGIIPAFIYLVYYVTVTLIHTSNGEIEPGYDWYAFFLFGIKTSAILVPLFMLFAYVLSFKLWKYNGGKRKKK